MNPLFLPNSDKEGKQGLERNKLLKNIDIDKKQDQKLKQNIPTNWFYNEKSTKELWDDLEACEVGKMEPPVINPLSKIDATREKIRKVISSYEYEDQELLMKMAEINSPDGEVGIENDDGIMLDAKTRLYEILDDHSDLTNQQSEMLDSLQSWFESVKNGERDIPNFLKEEELQKYDVDSLKILLDELEKEKADAGDRANDVYHSMIERMTKTINDCKAIINQKELEISQLKEQQNDGVGKRSLRRRTSKVFRDSTDQIEKLIRVQFQNQDLQHQINQLYAEKSQENLDPKQANTPTHPLGSGTFSQQEISDLILRNMELEGQMQLLSNQMNDEKEQNKYLQQQVFKLKQSDMVLNQRLTQLQKQKENLESSLKNSEEKVQLLQEEDKITSEPVVDEKTQHKHAKELAELKKKQDEKIEELQETQRVRIEAIQKDYDKKLKESIQQFASVFESSDKSAILQETIKLYNEKLEQRDKDNEKIMSIQREDAIMKYRELIDSYEELLRKKDFEIQKIQQKQEDVTNIKLKKAQLEYQEKLSQELMVESQKSYKEYSTMFMELSKKVDELKLQFKRAKREKNTMRTFLEVNGLLEEFEEEEEEEDTEDDKKDRANSDGFLSQSLQKLKEMDMEKKLQEKYNLLMQTQMSLMKDQQTWEQENSKQHFIDINKKEIEQFRAKIVEMTRETLLHIKATSDPKLQDYFSKILNFFGEIKQEASEVNKQIMLPADEVECKMESMRTKLLALLNENEIWKMTFDKLDGLQDKNATEILDALKEAIEEQSGEMSNLQSENDKLKKQLTQITDGKFVFEPEQQQQQQPQQSNTARSSASDRSVPRPPTSRKLRFARQYIFQVNPGTRRHFFVKLENTPMLPEGAVEFSCECANCHEDFIFRSREVKMKSSEQPFIMCPKCRQFNQIMCIDHAIETGQYEKYLEEIRGLKDKINDLEQRKNEPASVMDLCAKKKSIDLFSELSKQCLSLFDKNIDDSRKEKIVELIIKGLNELRPSDSDEELKSISDKFKKEKCSTELINNILEYLGHPILLESIKNNTRESLPMLDLDKVKDSDSSEQAIIIGGDDDDDEGFKYTPQPTPHEDKPKSSQSSSLSSAKPQVKSSRSVNSQRQQSKQGKQGITPIHQRKSSLVQQDQNQTQKTGRSQDQRVVQIETPPQSGKSSRKTSRDAKEEQQPQQQLQQQQPQQQLQQQQQQLPPPKIIKEIQVVTKTVYKLPMKVVKNAGYLATAIVDLKQQVETFKKLMLGMFKDLKDDSVKRAAAAVKQLKAMDRLREEIKNNHARIDNLQMQLGRASHSLQVLEMDKSSNDDVMLTMNRLQTNYELKLNELMAELLYAKQELSKSREEARTKTIELQQLHTAKDLADNVNKRVSNKETQTSFAKEVNNNGVPEIEVTTSPKIQPSTSGLLIPKSTRPSALRGEKAPKMFLPKSKRQQSKVYEPKAAQLIQYDPFSPGGEPDESGTSNMVVVTHVVSEDNSNLKAGNRPETPPLLFPSLNLSSPNSSGTQPSQRSPARPKTPLYNTAREVQQNTSLARLNEHATETLARRINTLEKTVQEYIAKLQESNNRLHDLQNKQYKTSLEKDKLAYELNKEKMLHTSAVTRLNKAAKLIDEKNRAINDLKELNNNFNKIAAEVTVLHNSSRGEGSQIGKLIDAFSNTTVLDGMAKNELRSIQRWMAKREKIMQKEEERIVKVLDALCLIVPEKGGHVQRQPLVQVTPMK